jgi:hypothetical protein
LSISAVTSQAYPRPPMHFYKTASWNRQNTHMYE